MLDLANSELVELAHARAGACDATAPEAPPAHAGGSLPRQPSLARVRTGGGASSVLALVSLAKQPSLAWSDSDSDAPPPPSPPGLLRRRHTRVAGL